MITQTVRARRVLSSVLGLLLLMLSAGDGALWAQLPTATILGTVKDASGAVVPGAAVNVKNTETGLMRTAETTADGRFRFPALPVGAYEVRVEHAGFQAAVRSGLTLAVSDEAVVNFTLEVGGLEQTISVTAEAPLVNTTSGAIGSLVTEQKVADLPLNGRNYIDLALAQPGVVQHKGMSNASSTVGTWFSSNGAPLRSNNYLLDGAILTNNTGATSASSDGSTLGIEGIREYRVITNSFSAEYGMTMGSQVVMVSKSGTNALHGSAFEFLRNHVLDARNFFDYPTVATGPDFRLPPFKRNQFGGSLGGSIRRDKTFFHGVYEGLRERLGTTNIANVPHAGCHGAANVIITPADCSDITAATAVAPQIAPLLALFPLPNLPDGANGVARYSLRFTQPTTEDFVQVRVDHSFSAASTFYARYSLDDTEQTNPLNYEIYQQVRDSRSQSGTVSENRVLRPSLLNTVRFSYSRTNPAVLSSKDLIGPEYSYLSGTPMGSLAITGFTSISPASKSLQRRNILSLSDDMFYSRGGHSLKFGVLLNAMHTYSNVNTQALGSVNFTTMRNFLLGLANTYNANTPGSILDRTYRYETMGLYLQDDFQLRQNLTLNLGLRYEFMTVPEETRGHGSAVRDLFRNPQPEIPGEFVGGATLGAPFRQMSLKNFSPRLGFAWDVRGDGRMAVRGGFAQLYDIAVFGQSLSIAVTGTPPFSTVSNVTQPTTITLPLVFPTTVSGGRSLRTLDYNLEQPHILDYHLTFERQLPGNLAVTVAYAGSRGLNILQTKDGNPTVRGGIWDGTNCVPAGAQAATAGENACWLGQSTTATAANPSAIRDLRNSPYWDGLEFKTAAGNSWYNSLQFSVNKRLSGGFQLQSSYTWAKVIDETQGQAGADNGTSSIFGAEPSRRQTDRAVADFDATHNWRMNFIYQVPRIFQGGGIAGMLTNGWRLSSILSLQTGYPFTPALNTNRSRSVVNTGGGGIDRPNMAAGRTLDDVILGGSTRYYDPTAFTLQRVGFLGNAGRNILRGPGLANLDFSLTKETALRGLGEAGRVEFRAEVFNILNRVNFGAPNRTVFTGGLGNQVEAPLATAGTILDTSTRSRQMQFALKLYF